MAAVSKPSASWSAAANEGLALEPLAKEIGAYKSTGSFRDDYAHFCTLLEVKAHPSVVSSTNPKAAVPAADEAKAEVKGEGKEGEAKAGEAKAKGSAPAAPAEHRPESLIVRHVVFDVGTARALGCVLPLCESMATLVLYGAALDDRAIDALASALARTRVQTLQLDYNGGAAKNATAFARFASDKMPLTALSLRGNQLGDAGARALAAALHSNTTVAFLNLFDNGITDGVELATALRYNVALKSISLSNNRVGDETALALFEALSAYELTPAADKAHCAAAAVIEAQIKFDKSKKAKDKAKEELPALSAPFAHGETRWCRGNAVLQFANLAHNAVTSDGVARIAALLRNRRADLQVGLGVTIQEINLQRNGAVDAHGEVATELLRLTDSKVSF